MHKLTILVAAAGLFSLSITASADAGHATEQASTQSDGTAWTCPMHADVVQDEAGECPKCGMKLVEAKEVYSCPMHSDVHSSQAGECPKCGMTMTAETEESGEHHHMDNH